MTPSTFCARSHPGSRRHALPARLTGSRWGLRDYGTGQWVGGDEACDHSTPRSRGDDIRDGNKQGTSAGSRPNTATACRCGAQRVDSQLGLEATPTQYVANMVNLFREVRRVLRDDGTLWLNLGDSYASNGERGNNNGQGASTMGWPGQRPETLNKVAGTRLPATSHGLKPKDLVGIPWAVAKAMQEPYYTGKIRDERDRIWLAAVVEAEGCLFIHKRKAGQSNGQGYARKNDSYGAGLEVASTDRVIAERCLAITGVGSLCEQTPAQNERRKQTIYRWNLRTNECRDVIRELYPHMIAKQHEARLLIGCPSSGDDARKAHESLKALHQGQAASIDFREPEGMWERGWFLRSEIIWAKCMPNPMPESVTDRPTKSHETVFLFSKQPRYFYDADAIREAAEYGYSETTNGRFNSRDANGEHVSRTVKPGDGAGGRNRRSVWTIPTEPFPEAHFATYPQLLVQPCILAGTSERGECVECGTPWRRVVERGELVGTDRGGNYTGRDIDPMVKRNGGTPGMAYENKTTGWEPSCSCIEQALHDDPTPAELVGRVQPQLVLDPFIGSGTTALVARKHGRRCIGIDLSAEYLEIAAKRTQQLSLLGGVA